MRRITRSAVHPVIAGFLAVAFALLVQTAFAAPVQAFTNVDLSTYKRVGRYDLPEPTRTAAPANNLLAQEASAVTYDWDTDTLFVAGDGGTAIVQVSKTGALINTMTLPPGGSPQGTEFYDTEGLTYVGNGEFVFTEERNRAAVRFTYVPGGTLTRAAAKTVKLGTTIGNIGLEGVTNDPISGGYVFVKEIEPKGIFQTGIDWEAGTATNGSPTTTESTNLFNPSLVPTIDFSDVYSLANVANLTGPQRENLLIISQESGKVVDVDRSGNVSSSLTLIRDPGNPLTIPAQTDEGVTMDSDGVLYVVNENGGGDANHPQLWVFESQSAPNQAPIGVSLTEQTTSLPETTSTSSRLRLAEPVVADDGFGSNQYSVTGADAAFFEVDSNGLYLKAGTTLNAATKSTYNINVSVQDPTVGGSSPVTVPYTLTITSTTGGSAGTNVAVTEVSPWSSGNSSYAADWWELTNTGTKKLDLTGWKMDDDSASATSAVALNGVSSLAPGESAIFIEGTASTAEAFKTAWFGGSPPAGFKIGFYAGSGVGLSTGGDQVNIFNAVEARVTGVAFGASTTGQTFDNTAAAGSTTAPLPVLTTLSSAGVNGAFTVNGETGSPGTAPVKSPVIVSEVAPWGSGTEASAYAADWWELTNISSQTIDLSGWKMDDESNSFGSAVALNGVTSLAPGESAIFLEGDSSKVSLFKTFWFGASVPAGVQFGTYSGSGVGLGTGGDQVNVFNGEGAHLTGVKFGSSTANVSFDNAAGLGGYGAPPLISTLSVSGVNGAFVAHDETGSPGTIKNPVAPPPLPSIKITEVSSASSSNLTYKADWWELTNTGSSAVNVEGWKMDDDSSAFASAVALGGVSSLAPGESAVFVEGTLSTAEAFKTAWFGGSPPAGFKIGFYSGSGVGLSSSGDQVNIFNSEGTKVTGVRFGAAGANTSFDNAAGIGSATESPPPLISTLSVNGVNGAFVASGETGSPGTIKNAVVPPPLPPIKITEVSSTSSSNSTYKADFWELTNTGASAVNIEGWKMDDDSSAFASAVALNGVTSIGPGESVIFVEGTLSTAEAFKTAWFGASPPAGFKIGFYSGSGVGLSSSGDQVNIFNGEGTKVTGVRFGAATDGVSFDNAAGIGSATESPPPLISTLSVNGVNGAFVASGETGSPGTIKNPPPPPPPVKITEVSSTSSSNSTYKADFWELTNTGASPVNIEGWKMDDDSSAFASAVALNGVNSLAPGESVIFVEGTASTAEAFTTAWFGSSPPAGFKIGSYSGSGVGLSSGGDQVNIFNSEGTKVTGVRFGAATDGVSFDNAAGIGSATESPPPLISTLSVAGVNGAFTASGETGSPGTLVNHPPVKTTGPTVTGPAFVGSSLSCDPGTWGGVPAPVFTYRWLRDGSPIGSATSSSYTTAAADAGAAVSCEVSATNAAGSVSATSNAIQMPAPGLDCSGVAITGAGTAVQSPQQDAWASVFPVSVCPGGPTVSYEARSERDALAAWSADGVSGTIDTGQSFIGTDRAPNAGEIANIGSAAGSGTNVAVIPVAQTAIGVVVNPPAGCELEEITNKQLESIFRGNVLRWGQIDTVSGSACAGKPITRVVSPGASGVTAQFKSYLLQLNKAALACTEVPGKTWGDLGSNAVWPVNGEGGCSATALNALSTAAGDSGADLVAKVNATAGSIGYAALPDIEAASAGDTHPVKLQNNGLVKLANATFAEPSVEASHSANCSRAKYTVPSAGQVGGSGENVDWSGVSGANLSVGGEDYPLCGLTFDVALTHYAPAGFPAGQAATVSDYLHGYVTTAAGQSDLANSGLWYAPLPTGGATKNDVLGAAHLAASKVGP